VLQLASYVTVDEVNGGELFYYLIESEGDLGSDPVLLWLTGGDRCSVLSALFFEIGQQPSSTPSSATDTPSSNLSIC
jgi:carboxypeptidase C (cathepsin A)